MSLRTKELPFVLIWIIGMLSARPVVHVGLISVMLPLAADS